MEPLTLTELQALPQSKACPRQDNPRYLGDCIVRAILAGNVEGLPATCLIESGIGRLTWDNGTYEFDTTSKLESLRELTLLELATHFGKAMEQWAEASFPVVDQATYDIRSRICERCKFWDRTARKGLGKCKAPGCGCTRFKRWLATEQCPLKLWPE